MLERTAGCLETGSLRRLLPATSEATRSTCLLKSLNRSQAPSELETPHSRNQSTISQYRRKPTPAPQPNSNTIFLDFLYPQNALNYLRSSSQKQNRPAGTQSSDGSVQRRYSSIVSLEAVPETVDDLYNFYNDQIKYPNEDEEGVIKTPLKAAEAEKLRVLLKSSRHREDYEEAWRLFNLVPMMERGHFGHDLIRYLAKSERIVDNERIILLFDRLAASSTPRIRQALLNAHIKLGNLVQAVKMLEVFLQNYASSHGCAAVFGHAIQHHNWKLALRVYSAEAKFRAHDSNVDEVAQLWTDVEQLSNLQDLALALGQYVERKLKPKPGEPVLTAEVQLRSMLENMIDKALVPYNSHYRFNKLPQLLQMLSSFGFESGRRYEQLILNLIKLKNVYSASRCYQLYRRDKSSRGKISQHLLRSLITNSTNPQDIEAALDDWIRYHGNPVPLEVRQAALTQMSRHGDVAQVLDMSKRKEGRMTVQTLAPILHAHAKRGQLSEVSEIWKTHFTSGHVTPNLRCWNILFNAYGKANDVEGALEKFYELLKTTTAPDSVSFSTIMQICAKHGDFEQVMEFYRLAENLGVHRTPDMIDAVVLGHVKADHLTQAEKICTDATESYAGEALTITWNLLLTGYAFQRDLTKITQLFQKMQDYKIPYNADSYAALMQCLAMCKLPDRANAVLKNILQEADIMPNQFHYAIVMGGFLATREPRRVFAIHRHMRKQGLKDNVSTRLMQIKASAMLEQQDSKSLGWNDETQEVRLNRAETHFQHAMAIDKSKALDELIDVRRKGTKHHALDVMGETSYYAFMMFTYGAHGAIERVKELYQEYEQLLSKDQRAEPPIEILTALMSANLKKQNYAGVEQCWEVAYASARKNCSKTDGKGSTKILEAHRYALATPLSAQIQSLSRQHRFNELAKLVEDVQAAGFVLDRKNWNIYCQVLVVGYHYKAAFEVCETKLMSGFAGFAHTRWRLPVRNRLSVEHRNWKKDARNLRPLTHTLLFLGRALLDLHDSSLESRAAQQQYDEFVSAYPRTVSACRNLRRNDDAERLVFSKDT